jgi:hypothetical protein
LESAESKNKINQNISLSRDQLEQKKFSKKWNERRGDYTILTKAPNERRFTS